MQSFKWKPFFAITLFCLLSNHPNLAEAFSGINLTLPVNVPSSSSGELFIRDRQKLIKLMSDTYAKFFATNPGFSLSGWWPEVFANVSECEEQKYYSTLSITKLGPIYIVITSYDSYVLEDKLCVDKIIAYTKLSYDDSRKAYEEKAAYARTEEGKAELRRILTEEIWPGLLNFIDHFAAGETSVRDRGKVNIVLRKLQRAVNEEDLESALSIFASLELSDFMNKGTDYKVEMQSLL